MKGVQCYELFRGKSQKIMHFLGDPSKTIALHLPVCQLYRLQLGAIGWSSPMIKSLDPIAVTAILVGFSGESLRPATGGFACKCPVPEAWTMEVPGQRCLEVHD